MNSKIVQVAAGVVVNAEGEILIAKRPMKKHQGGLWEFPGGKIEGGESAHQALARELQEEVGIHITVSEPLIKIKHSYPDKTVCLHVLRVTEFEGHAWGCEGQEVAWVSPDKLLHLEFPAANTPIVAAARLPGTLMITGNFDTPNECLQKLERGLAKAPGMVQFRAPWLSTDDYLALARRVHAVCRARSVPLIANCPLPVFQAIACEGLHLTSARLKSAKGRPVGGDIWLSAACHDLSNLQQAEAIGVDFVTLSPVLATSTHPNQSALGWDKFGRLIENARLPIYALGGMSVEDMSIAKLSGAQGIAAIGFFWES